MLSLAALATAAGAAFGFTLAGRPAATPATALQVTTAPTREHQLTPAPRHAPASTSTPDAGRSAAPPSPAPSPRQTARPAAPAAAPGSAPASAALPVITVGGYTGMKPSQITFSADSGNTVTGIAWTTWAATGATGYGRSDLGICIPSCVYAPANLVAATIVLSDPVHGRFTQLTETRNGSTVTYSYPANWPVSAS